MKRIFSIIIFATFACHVFESPAQENLGMRNAQMGFAIEESLRLDEGRFKIEFPPRNDSLLGAIVVIKSDGELEVLHRLPSKAVAQKVERRGRAAESELLINSDAPMLSKLLAFETKSDQSVLLRFEATNIEQVTVAAVREDGFAEALGQVEPLFASHKGQSLYLVSSVCRGQVRATMSWPNSPEPEAASKLDYFQLSRPRFGESTIAIESNVPVEFGYRLDLLTYSPVEIVNARIKRVPKKADESPPTQWEATLPLFGAGNAFHQVRVFYATDRQDLRTVLTEPPTPQFWQHFLDFYLLNSKALAIIFAVVAAIWFVAARWLLWLRKWTVGAAILLLVPALSPLLAWRYASQELAKAVDGNASGLSADRGDLTYGTCEVSIPIGHETGSMEKPFAMFLIELRPENPAEDVTFLKRSNSVGWKPFVGMIEERLDASPERETFVFIHGYNNSFEEAAKRTAQFWYDLRFEGPPILYSWPSQGTVAQYTTDENEVLRSEHHFKAFLHDLLKDSTAKRVHLIAHSMGNRILANTLVSLAGEGVLDQADCRIHEVVLAAPDIDAEVFQMQLAPKFVKRQPRVTLYASSNDDALRASKSVMVNKYRRAGDADEGIVVVDGLESIDASQLNTSLETHGYFAAYRTVIADIRDVIVNGLPPRKRGLDEKKHGDLSYFVIPK